MPRSEWGTACESRRKAAPTATQTRANPRVLNHRQMNSQPAQLLYEAKAELAEGPVWHDGALWWTNISAGTLHRLDLETGQNTSRATGDFLSCAVPTTAHDWLIARRNEVSRFDWTTGKITPVAALPTSDPRLRFNDGKTDPAGRFFVGTMHRDLTKGQAAFYRLTSGQLQTQITDVTISNGLDWSPDRTRFYYTDTPTGRVDVFDYDVTTGVMLNRRPLVTIDQKSGYPDGLCCDAEGNLWVALWGGSRVECFDGLTGKSLTQISVPTRQVSSCCFGGPERNQLFITTAWEGYSETARAVDPLAGSLFTLQPGVRGQALTLAQI